MQFPTTNSNEFLLKARSFAVLFANYMNWDANIQNDHFEPIGHKERETASNQMQTVEHEVADDQQGSLETLTRDVIGYSQARLVTYRSSWIACVASTCKSCISRSRSKICGLVFEFDTGFLLSFRIKILHSNILSDCYKWVIEGILPTFIRD